MPFGKWSAPDSSVELTAWPPAFSVAIAAAQSAGLSPRLSARLVLAASAAATIALTALILADVLSGPLLIGALALIAVTPSFIAVHLSVLSEPLFIASLALTLFAMLRGRPLVAAIGAGFAVMTRYAGASAAVGCAVWFLFFEKGGIKDRLRRAALSSAPAALAFTLWMVHNSRVRVVQSAIAVAYYPGILSTLRDGLVTLLSWVAPTAGVKTAVLVAVAVAAGLTLLLVASRQARIDPAASVHEHLRGISGPAAVLFVSYLAVLVCSRLFVGGAIRFDARILSPAIYLLEVALIPVAAAAFAGRRRAVQSAGALVAAAWMVAAVFAEGPVVLDSIEDGNDFAASDWRESETVKWIERNGRQYSIYSNWPAAVYFDAHRNAFDLPTSAESDTLARFGRLLAANYGVLAAFNERSFDYPRIDSIAAGAGLVKLQTLSDGAIWAPKRARR